MALVTYEQAKSHLRLFDDNEADDLNLKIDLATAMVLTHAKREDHAWDENTDPSEDLDFAIVQAAILEVLTNLYAERGDGNVKDGPITPRVVSMLAALRDPTVA